MKNIGWLKEKIKNLPDEHPLKIGESIGALRNVEDAYFDSECFIIRPEGHMTTPIYKPLEKKYTSPPTITPPHTRHVTKAELDTALKTELANGPHRKIYAIKLCRELTGLGLKEAKDYVENLMRKMDEF